MRLIFGILITLASFSFAQATEKEVVTTVPAYVCTVGPCNGLHNPAPGLGAAAQPTLCVLIRQAAPGTVVIRFYDEQGKELDKDDTLHSQPKAAVDEICPYRSWFVKAQKGHVEVCNKDKMKILRPEHIAILLAGGMPANTRVQLFATNKS